MKYYPKPTIKTYQVRVKIGCDKNGYATKTFNVGAKSLDPATRRAVSEAKKYKENGDLIRVVSAQELEGEHLQ